MIKAALTIALFGLFLAAAPRTPPAGEPAAEAATARALVRTGSLDIAREDAPPELTIVREGRSYADAGLLPAIALLPAEALSGLAPPRARPRIEVLLGAATAALLAALVCLLFYGDLERLGASRRLRIVATLLLATTTALFAAARSPDGSALAALLLLLAVRGARSDSAPGALLAGLAAGALALVDPGYLPAALLLCALAAGRRRSFGHAVLLGLPLIALGAIAFAHRALLGWPLEPPGDLLDGLYGLTLSTGKSAFLYSPPLALALFALPWWWRRRRFDALLLVAVAAALCLGVAARPRWDGDPAWGPRRLFLVVPLLLEPVALWLGDLWARGRVRGWVRVALAGLAVNGALVTALGAAFAPSVYLGVVDQVRVATGAEGWFAEPRAECHFIPQFSPLTGHFWLLEHYLRRDGNLGSDAPWTLLQEPNPKLTDEARQLRLDWWYR